MSAPGASLGTTAAFETRPLAPFGLEVAFTGDQKKLADIDADLLAAWVREHRVVVLRGLTPSTKLELPLAARALGPLQAWEFGSIHELVVKRDSENYLYTSHAVPLHWDGAFVQRAPHYLVFQCNAAPARDESARDNGATIFVDTARVWAKADAATRDRWRALTFHYATDKLAHYGGSFRARVVSQHEVTGETVLRFAEPVDDKNPVHVECEGVSPLDSARLIGELRDALYHADATYEHAWREGDVVIADNLALLHGRRAFDEDAPRRIWRVNVHRKTEPRFVDAVKASLRIRRPEFMVAEIPIFAIPLVLAAHATSTSPYLLLPLAAAFLLLFHFGDMVNCYADRFLDSVYKTQQSEAVFRLGLANVRVQIALTVVAAVALAVQLASSIGRWTPLVLVAGGLAWGAQYSLRPLWLKSRGVLQLVTLCAIIFVGPMILVADVVRAQAFSWSLALLFCAYATMQMGVILVNTAEDLPEDRASGIRTAAVALGLVPVLRLALAMTFVGGAGVIALLAMSGGASFGLVPLVAAFAFAALGVADVHAAAVRSSSESAAVDALRKRSRRLPLWIAATAWGTLVAALASGSWTMP